MKTTSKKQKTIQVRTLIDPKTGELIPTQEVCIIEKDFNFHKIWLQHLVNSLDGISNQKLRLAFWIIENLNKENQLVMTQRAIAEKAGMSLNTVTKTMKALQTGSPAFLVKINSGAYMVNPDVIWKGSHENRMGILFEYTGGNKTKSAEAEEATTEEATTETEAAEPEKNHTVEVDFSRYMPQLKDE